MGESPFFQSGNPARFQDSTGESNVVRQAGLLQASNGGSGYTPVGAPELFVRDTLNRAQLLMPALGLNRVVGTDFTPAWEAALVAANAPTLDIQFAAGATSAMPGGTMSFGAAAGTSQLALNPTTPGGTAWNPILGFFGARASAWLMRGRFLINAQAFTAGKNIVLMSLDATYSGGLDAAATTLTASRCIQLRSDGTTDPRQLFIRVSGAPGAGNISAGPDCVLGGIQSRLPVNQWFTAWLGFDGQSIFWGIGDDVVNPANRLNALIGQMDNFPSEAAAVTIASNDTIVGTGFKCDAIAIAFQASQENK